MATIYYVISDPKTGKTYQKALEELHFQGKKIGETVPGSQLGLVGYDLQITGGSDLAGFPLIKHLEGPGRKSLMLSRSKGASGLRKDVTIRKTVVGNTISLTTAQVNLKVMKPGTKSVPELLGIQPKEEVKPAAAEAPIAETKPAEKKPEVKKEEKKH